MRKSPSLAAIDKAADALKGRVVRTPALNLSTSKMKAFLPEGSTVNIKMEMFQNAGSFKYRGTLLGVDNLTPEERKRGVVAASAGNHAIAVSTAAQAENIHARIAMPRAADPMRAAACRAMGAQIDLYDTINDLFAGMEQIAKDDGRTILHPYEASHMTLGAATCGVEFARDCPDMDMVIVPVGGGGFISGMSAGIKHILPHAEVIGVEPYGADTMFQSFAAGHAVGIDKVDTIADSLGAPTALAASFEVTRENVVEIVRVHDSALIKTMRLMFECLKITPEPACAASLAAILGPLKARATGKNIGVVACGSNISLARFAALVEAG